MDNKYGRLFTENDVKRLVSDMAKDEQEKSDFLNALQEALGAQGPSLTFPADEPLFLLRGKDHFARGTISKYRDLCSYSENVTDEHLEGIDKALYYFNEYATKNETKIPD